MGISHIWILAILTVSVSDFSTSTCIQLLTNTYHLVRYTFPTGLSRSVHDTMKNFTSRGRTSTDDRKPAERITSPTPSIRHISHRRVVDERGPLLGKAVDSDYLTFNGSKSSKNRGADGRSSDEESIVYRSSSAMDQSQSVDYMLPQHALSSISEYIPGGGNDTLDWGTLMPYYLPFLSWIFEYTPSYFLGDLIGGVSLATFQIPLAISYATSLAKLPVTCGLYSLGISPLIYLLLGSVPQMIVGPEAPISLIVGQAVEPLLHHAKKQSLDPVEYVVAISITSGATLLGFGLGRFGFLDNVLCDSLLKGFICGVGVVMVISSSISMLGLTEVLERVIKDPKSMDVHSPFDKFKFVVTHYSEYHPLTFKVSMGAFVIVMLIRQFKSYAASSGRSQLKHAVYIPEILMVIVGTTILCNVFHWDDGGLEVVGSVEDAPTAIPIYNPFSMKLWPLVKQLYPSGFLCAMLGFFESTTALKSLGSRYDLPISSNRELVALGAINVVGAVFGGLPAFGGYGRSKINAISAKTTTSGAIMGIISLASIGSILQYLHFIPKCILSVITAVIGILLISEAPGELNFHWNSRGYNELITFAITVLTTLFFSMEAGIAVGLIYLLLRVIKNSAESRIQILGRVPGTNTFLDADLANALSDGTYSHNSGSNMTSTQRNATFEKSATSQLNLFTDTFRPLNFQALEEIEGCLIIKIPEPLTFTNASDLRARLMRVERYGSAKAHPASKRSRDVNMTKYMIFDLDDMAYIDSSATQILKASLLSYQKRGIRSFFVRVSKDPNLRKRLQATGVFDILMTDLTHLKYFETQKLMAWNRRHNANEASLDDNAKHSDFDEQSISEATESIDSPFFEHIRSALKFIDFYELHMEPSLMSELNGV